MNSGNLFISGSSSGLGAINMLSTSSLSVNPVSLLLFFVITSMTKSVPTAEFGDMSGGKEVALSSRSLHWSPTTSTHYQKRRETQPIQLCGYRLLEAVRALCRGNYVGYNRRSDPDMPNDRVRVMIQENGHGSNKHRERHTDGKSPSVIYTISDEPEKNGASSHLLRYRRNIIDECCRKPCSVNEMIKYCGRN